jgi:excisionase family DNA binding protein
MTLRRHRSDVVATDRSAEVVLLTVDEVSTLLRTTRKAVYAMVDRGLLPGVVRIARRLLFRRESLLAGC